MSDGDNSPETDEGGAPIAVGDPGNLEPDPEQQNQQPVSDGDLHDPSRTGPSSAPPATAQSLDPATRAGLAGGQTPAEGGSEPPVKDD